MKPFISLTPISAFFVFFAVEVWAQEHRPHKWPQGAVMLNSGQVYQGKLFYQPAAVETDFVKPVATEEPNKPTGFQQNVARHQIGVQEKIYLYLNGEVKSFNAEQVAGFYFDKTFKKPIRCFTSLPYRFEGGETHLYFFEVMAEGQISLLQHHAFVKGLGVRTVHFLALSDQELFFSPSDRAVTVKFLMEKDPRIASFVQNSYLNYYEDKNFVKLFERYNTLNPSQLFTEKLLRSVTVSSEMAE